MGSCHQDKPCVIDVAVIGGGPAGISAALRLKARGVPCVAILERDAMLGGALLLSTRRAYGLWQFGRLLTGPAYAARLVQAARAAGVEILPGHEVTALRPSGVVETLAMNDAGTFTARRVLLTGKFPPIAASHLCLDAGTGGPAVDQYGRCSDVSYFAAGTLAGNAGPGGPVGAAAGDYIADDLSGGLPSLEGRLEVLAGQGIRYVVPQFLAHVVPLRGRLGVCVAEAVKGQLRVRAGEAVLYRRRVAALPEQCLAIKLDGMKTPPDDAELIVEIVP
ncbi:MAG: FAD-binding protein [Rhodospirillales bacterium]|nr:FAD-binding protein [Rhodospirillales bacterium]